jgi:hypothetical protein
MKKALSYGVLPISYCLGAVPFNFTCQSNVLDCLCSALYLFFTCGIFKSFLATSLQLTLLQSFMRVFNSSGTLTVTLPMHTLSARFFCKLISERTKNYLPNLMGVETFSLTFLWTLKFYRFHVYIIC